MIIDDNYILNKFLDKNGNPNRRRLRSSFLSEDELMYLQNRFKVYDTLSEVVYRIKYKIEELPKCPTCGKEIHYYKESRPFLKYCSHWCKNKNTKHNEKIKQTKFIHYGDENYNNIQKAKQTLFEKYGDENYNNRDKAVQTYLQKFGTITPLQNKECREKGKQTLLLKYGVDNYGKTKEHIIATHTPEANAKRIATKRRNNTFNVSKPEDESYILLQTYFIDVKRNYKTKLYPFLCDFYIPEKDLYIECNYHWTHGGHPFDENNQEDIDRLNKLKSKNTKFYNTAIDVWTIRDINKRNIAKENKLNYIEVWKYDELEQWLSENFTKLNIDN